MSAVSVVVVSYETRDLLLACLDTLPRAEAEVIVVDNASTDGSAAAVRERYPTVNVIENPENIGFGHACNLGIGDASGDHVVILNADTLPEPGSIRELVACAEAHPRAGAIAASLVDESGRWLQSTGRYPTRLWTGRAAMTSFPPHRRAPGSADAAVVHGFAAGAAVLLRREAIDEIGGFDRRYFMFYEDVDLCWRLQQTGWEIVCCPGARVVHIGGASTRSDWPRFYAEQLRSHLTFIERRSGPLAARMAHAWLVAAIGVRSLVSRGPERAGYHAGLRSLLGGRGAAVGQAARLSAD